MTKQARVYPKCFSFLLMREASRCGRVVVLRSMASGIDCFDDIRYSPSITDCSFAPGHHHRRIRRPGTVLTHIGHRSGIPTVEARPTQSPTRRPIPRPMKLLSAGTACSTPRASPVIPLPSPYVGSYSAFVSKHALVRRLINLLLPNSSAKSSGETS